MRDFSMDKDALSKTVDEIAERWKIFGGVAVCQDDQVIHNRVYGYADRENEVPMTEKSTYLVSAYAQFLLGIGILKLAEQGMVALDDTIDRFLPEYQYGDQITISDLLLERSGIPDYFYGKIMVDLQKDAAHQALSAEEQFVKEKDLCARRLEFKDVLEMIGDMPLEYAPGTRDYEDSMSNAVFLGEIMERITKMDLMEYEWEHILKPLHMSDTRIGDFANTVSYGTFREKTSLRIPKEMPIPKVFTTTAVDLLILTKAFQKGKMLSKKAWKAGLTYTGEGRGMIADNANGIACTQSMILGYEILIYFDQKADISYISFNSAEQTYQNDGDEYLYARKELRGAIEEATTFPRNTKLVPYNDANAYAAMSIKVREDQHAFVDDAKTALCFACAHKSERPFVLMEGDRAVGLLILDIDKKKDLFDISIVQIDKRYQHRGFGKIMLNEGIAYLKKQGAKVLEIGVNRYNKAAQNLYKSAGFEIARVYVGGMSMRMVLGDSTGKN